MVNRQLTPASNKCSANGSVTVVDLDGTYLTCNSLTLYLKVALKYAATHLRIDRVMGISLLCILRKLRLVSHETMKYKAISIAGEAPRMREDFRCAAREKINREVEKFLKDRSGKGDTILLATAAADCYVPLVWDGEFIASPMGGPDKRGVRKRDAVMRWITGRGLKISNFLTDHHEDLPLAEYVADNGGNVILVNPSPKTIQKFNSTVQSARLTLE